MAFMDMFCGCAAPSGERDTTLIHAENPISERTPSSEVVIPGLGLALFYEPDASDPDDVELSKLLDSLDPLTGANLAIRRMKRGKYLVCGRLIRLVRGADDELMVVEMSGDVYDRDTVETPLLDYLHQAANVNASVSGHCRGISAVNRVPHSKRMTFMDAPVSQVSDDPGDERVSLMKKACEQAKLREQAAEYIERFNNAPTSGSMYTSGSMFTPRPVCMSRSTTPPPIGSMLLGRTVAGLSKEASMTATSPALTMLRMR